MTQAATPTIEEWSYSADSVAVFNHLAQQQWSIFLDSGFPESQQGRFDIFAADPFLRLITKGNQTRIETRSDIDISNDDPFTILGNLLSRYPSFKTPLPFTGGAIGYFSYDLGRRLERISQIAEDDIDMPDMAVGFYDWVIVVDHQQQQCFAIHNGFDKASEASLSKLREHLQQVSETGEGDFNVLSEPVSNLDYDAYAKAYQRIKHYIVEGDCYQVNLAQRFKAEVEGDSWAAYRRLRDLNPAPYAAYMRLPEGSVLCSSPERFLKVDAGKVETKPIKGTRARSTNPEEDLRLQNELQQSKKDQAENVMIVDLLRNDISKSCKNGSVKVPALFEIESFATVHHLVSTVTGELDENKSASDLLRASFPGGSIIGAPKLRAMEIIEELEPHRRSVYCGAIGYIGFDGNMDTNISIRTLVINRGNMYCWAGGGIVKDSDEQDEYQESLDKAAAMLRLYDSFR